MKKQKMAAEGEVHLRAAGEAVRPYLRGCVPHGRHHGREPAQVAGMPSG